MEEVRTLNGQKKDYFNILYMKQTAVEWLVEQICGNHTSQWQKEIQQAKAMEKEQIKDAYEKGKKYKKPIKDSNPI